MKLGSQPSANVTVSVISDDEGAATVSHAQRSFTSSNWNTPQTVTVTRVRDPDARNESVMVSLTTESADTNFQGKEGSVTVNVTDDDMAGLVVAPTVIDIGEGGSDDFTVRLATEPSDVVTVSVRFDDLGAATVSTDSLEFTASDWSEEQTVTVSGKDDPDALDEMVMLSLTTTTTDADYQSEDGSVTVNVTDDDTAGLVVDPTDMNIDEGASDDFTVKLATEPSAEVTVTVVSDDPGAATVSTDSLKFTPSDWSTEQTVTVSGADDPDLEDETVTVSLTAVSDDTDYQGEEGSVEVDVADNDMIGLVVDPAAININEGESGDFAVRLGAEPSDTVEVSVRSEDEGAATVSPASLDFTPSDWSTEQTVTVSGKDDPDTLDEMVMLSLSAVSDDTDYDEEEASVEVDVADDDTVGFVVDPETINIEEGDNDDFTVKLATQPSDNVEVSVRSEDEGAVTVTPASLDFTPSTWSANQTVTVSSVVDADFENESVTVSLSTGSDDTDYQDVRGSLTVNVAEPAYLDATLSALTVEPRDIIGFAADRYSYEVGVGPSVDVAILLATANHAGASVAFDTEDVDDNTDGHQVALSTGRNLVTVTVTAADRVTTQDYSVSVNRGVAEPKAWQAGADLDGLIAAGNERPDGIWSNGTTMWVADSEDAKIYAYRLADGSPEPGKDFDTLAAAGNQNPRGIWSDETTMWVLDRADHKIYAYKMSDRSRDAAKDFDRLATRNEDARGIWSDGTTMWVGDSVDAKVYAYQMSNGARDADKDIVRQEGSQLTGIWSEGFTMWVVDERRSMNTLRFRFIASNISNGKRQEYRDFDSVDLMFDVISGGIWSDGDTIWIASGSDGVVVPKVYAINIPPPDVRDLAAKFNEDQSGVNLNWAATGLTSHTGYQYRLRCSSSHRLDRELDGRPWRPSRYCAHDSRLIR